VKTRQPVVSLVLLTAALSGCSISNFKPTAPFNPREVAWSTQGGTNAVSGRIAALGTDGVSYPCNRIWLVPDSTYIREIRMQAAGTTGDITYIRRSRPPLVMTREWDTDLYQQTSREGSCSPNGEYSFRNLATGTWYLLAMGGPASVGYFVQRRLELRGNDTARIYVP